MRLSNENNSRIGGHDNPVFTHEDVSLPSEEETTLRLHGSNSFTEVVEGPTKRRRSIDLLKSATPWIKNRLKKTCTKKLLFRRLPFLNWLPKYDTSCLLGDLLAGITVGLTVIPQSLAYSNVAGLPAQYGLYGSFLGCFIYIVLGSCKDVPVGPTAIASLLTYQTVRSAGVEHAVLLCFLTGVVHLVMAVFGLGFLIDFVSGPVSSGFTSAVALIIVTSQVKDVLGISTTGTTFFQMWISIFKNIGDTKMWDAITGVACIIVLLAMRLLTKLDKKDKLADDSTFKKTFRKSMWIIGTSRNAICVIICGLVGYIFDINGGAPFALVGYVPPGLPEVKPPPFSVTTGNETLGFLDMASNLGSGIIVLPLLTILEDVAICKAFSTGVAVDATQELVAIGISNVASSFFQAFPITGSVSRSAVNNSSGVKTPLGGLYTGILVILALLFFTPYFYYIPKASLAGVIIAAVVFMVEVKVVKPMWRTKKSDLIPGLSTFLACLMLQLEIGILTGIGVNLLFILYQAARPKIRIENLKTKTGAPYLMLAPDRCLLFPSVDYVRNLVNKHSLKQAIPVVIDCSHIYGADYTAATVVSSLVADFDTRSQPLLFYNLKSSVSAVFEGLSPKKIVVCYSEDDLEFRLRGLTSSERKDDGFKV